MTENVHARAEQLIARERIEGIGDSDRAWLAAHLAECERCNAVAAEMKQALAALRSVPIEVPLGLVSRTQMRVHLRADELREREPGNKILWALTVVSWALGVASAPLVWRGFAWFGSWAGLPKPVWEMGVVLWWTVPALLAAGAVLIEKRGQAKEIE
jgi:anti-sigma factor RsiW